jgi:N-methylhydantoinase B/acetone carboxylase alpha subunit
VVRDLNEGYLLPRYASVVYGVIAHQDEQGTWQLDADKTAERRREIRKERLAKAVPTQQYLESERKRILNRELAQPVVEMYRSSMEPSAEWREKYISFWNLDPDFQF